MLRLCCRTAQLQFCAWCFSSTTGKFLAGRNLMRGWLVVLSVFCVFVVETRGVQADGNRRPNFIFILTDDQGWGDAGFAGHPYVRTPALDRLKREGTWLQQFYVAATVCSPSRTAFMTGQYPARHAIHGHLSTPEQNAARAMPNWLN
ncbi:MAG: sulfatase-like hydrolase/transferase, partial [Planctomycetaceae bacterium]